MQIWLNPDETTAADCLEMAKHFEMKLEMKLLWNSYETLNMFKLGTVQQLTKTDKSIHLNENKNFNFR